MGEVFSGTVQAYEIIFVICSSGMLIWLSRSMSERSLDRIYCRVRDMKREYKLFLKDILENIDTIKMFVSGMRFEVFEVEKKWADSFKA